MSWSDYVNEYLLNVQDGDRLHQNISSSAAIIGVDGSVWASSENFEVYNF